VTIDTSFDFRSDTPPGKDPDSHSPTLHRYHQLLWSKPLPTGTRFDLVDERPINYLVHRSDMGVFFLSSDAVIPTLKHKARAIIAQLPDSETEAFDAVGYTMGGMMLFPANRIGGKATINGARGFHPRIADRFDLTLECIHRHYRGDANPLGDTLMRYRDFFALFRDFAGYVDFFLLQDLVGEDGDTVEFFTAFDDFKTPAIPQDVDAYRDYRRRSIVFVQARNQRILDSGVHRRGTPT
jgi:hypothetical protein